MSAAEDLSQQDQGGGDRRWWLDDETAHTTITTIVRRLNTSQESRREQDLRHARLYGNLPMMGFGPRAYARQETTTRSGGPRLGLNIVKNMCGAVTAKITKNRPKPTFLTETAGAENAYSLQRKAQQLEKFVEGQFYECGLYETAPQVFLDACIFGTGVIKVYEDDGAIKCERVFPFEITVSDDEAIYGERSVRSMYQRKYVDRLVLAEQYPDHRAMIMAAGRDKDDEATGFDPTADQVVVTEAWHLPSAAKMKKTDGRHAIVIENQTLFCEEWESDRFPFAFIRWSRAPMGFWGIGLADELRGIQLEINKILQEIQLAFHLLGKPKVFIERGSKILKSMFNNETATFVEYSNTPPIIQPPSLIPPEMYSHLWQLYSKGYEIAGISQLAAQSQKPEGVDSAIGMRTLIDNESERFIVVGREYENLFLTVSELVLEIARKMKGSLKVKAHGKGFVAQINFKDVDMKRDEYYMKIFPASMLPSTPAGRLSFVNDMQQLGISQDDALELIDIPDTEKFQKRRNAPRRIIERNLESMLDPKEPTYIPPEPFDNHALAFKLVNEAYAEARLDGVPEESLQLLQRYIVTTKKYLNPPPPANTNGQPPAGAQPPGPPGPPMNDNGAPPMAMAANGGAPPGMPMQ